MANLPELDLDTQAFDKAFKAVQKMDSLIAPEFEEAGELSVKAIIKDYRRGTGDVTGNLDSGIIGELTKVVGTEIDAKFQTTATKGGYNYGMRLDKDGSMSWRTGKFAGSRTFGWWSYIFERVSRKITKREFSKALQKGVARIVAAMKTG